jgi:hypothetical protein
MQPCAQALVRTYITIVDPLSGPVCTVAISGERIRCVSIWSKRVGAMLGARSFV